MSEEYLNNRNAKQFLENLKDDCPTEATSADIDNILSGGTVPAADEDKYVSARMMHDYYMKNVEVMQGDWEQTDNTKDDYIANKPNATVIPREALDALDKRMFAYGIQYDINIADSSCTRIGNMALHRSLPIQSKMRGCLMADDGSINDYLDPSDWTLATRDGSLGQVMVEIPEHYRLFETEGDIYRCWLSELPLKGFHKVPKIYVGAYEATYKRTGSNSGQVCSIINYTADYRGGNNQSGWDGTYRSQLGRPISGNNAFSVSDARKGRTDSSGNTVKNWTIYSYDIHKELVWLYVVEYANRNIQLPFNSQLTEEGFRQGGLGEGVTNWTSSEWSSYNSTQAFVPCGHTDSLGNGSGVIDYTAYDSNGDVYKVSSVPRYRGIENLYGHMLKRLEGIKVRTSPTPSNGGDGLARIYVCDDFSKITDSSTYKFVGYAAQSTGFITRILGGEDGDITATRLKGSSSSFFADYQDCDFSPSSDSTERVWTFKLKTRAFSGAEAGLFNLSADRATLYDVGSRLCFVV